MWLDQNDKRTCCYCGKTGHIAPDCPERETKPWHAWHMYKAVSTHQSTSAEGEENKTRRKPEIKRGWKVNDNTMAVLPNHHNQEHTEHIVPDLINQCGTPNTLTNTVEAVRRHATGLRQQHPSAAKHSTKSSRPRTVILASLHQEYQLDKTA